MPMRESDVEYINSRLLKKFGASHEDEIQQSHLEAQELAASIESGDSAPWRSLLLPWQVERVKTLISKDRIYGDRAQAHVHDLKVLTPISQSPQQEDRVFLTEVTQVAPDLVESVVHGTSRGNGNQWVRERGRKKVRAMA